MVDVKSTFDASRSSSGHACQSSFPHAFLKHSLHSTFVVSKFPPCVKDCRHLCVKLAPAFQACVIQRQPPPLSCYTFEIDSLLLTVFCQFFIKRRTCLMDCRHCFSEHCLVSWSATAGLWAYNPVCARFHMDRNMIKSPP